MWKDWRERYSVPNSWLKTFMASDFWGRTICSGPLKKKSLRVFLGGLHEVALRTCQLRGINNRYLFWKSWRGQKDRGQVWAEPCPLREDTLWTLPPLVARVTLKLDLHSCTHGHTQTHEHPQIYPLTFTYIYPHTHTYTHIYHTYLNTHAYPNIFKHTHKYTPYAHVFHNSHIYTIHAHIYVHTLTHIWTHIHILYVYIFTYIQHAHALIYTYYSYIYIHTHINPKTHTYTHKHTPTLILIWLTHTATHSPSMAFSPVPSFFFHTHHNIKMHLIENDLWPLQTSPSGGSQDTSIWTGHFCSLQVVGEDISE